MGIDNKKLILEQLNTTLKRFSAIKSVNPPRKGWIRAIRDALGISTRQLGSSLCHILISASSTPMPWANTLPVTSLKTFTAKVDIYFFLLFFSHRVRREHREKTIILKKRLFPSAASVSPARDLQSTNTTFEILKLNDVPWRILIQNQAHIPTSHRF